MPCVLILIKVTESSLFLGYFYSTKGQLPTIFGFYSIGGFYTETDGQSAKLSPDEWH
jgi:hypothetical protein